MQRETENWQREEEDRGETREEERGQDGERRWREDGAGAERAGKGKKNGGGVGCMGGTRRREREGDVGKEEEREVGVGKKKGDRGRRGTAKNFRTHMMQYILSFLSFHGGVSFTSLRTDIQYTK